MILLDQQKLDHITSGFHIPAKPALLSQITDEIESPEPSLETIANIISKDVSLSALLLKTINSPLFGLNRTISDIRQAAMFLGLDQLKLLVTATLLRQSFSGDACISLERFWDESLEIANTCMYLGRRYKLQLAADDLYSIGLFHNVGIAAMALRFNDYVDVLKHANQHPQYSVTQLEQQHYQSDHATIGYFIATSWHLPQQACYVILHHHDPQFMAQSTNSTDRLIFAILKCAESAVNYARTLRYSKEWEKIKASCFSELGIVDDEFDDLVEDYMDIIQTR